MRDGWQIHNPEYLRYGERHAEDWRFEPRSVCRIVGGRVFSFPGVTWVESQVPISNSGITGWIVVGDKALLETQHVLLHKFMSSVSLSLGCPFKTLNRCLRKT